MGADGTVRTVCVACIGALAVLASCGDGSPATDAAELPDARTEADADLMDAAEGVDTPEPDEGLAEVAPEVEIMPPAPCQAGLAVEASGTRRGDLAEDFELALVDGRVLSLAATFNGCESFVFIADALVISALDATPLWESDGDLADLLARSPDDVHYVFVSTASAEAAPGRVSEMQARIDALVDGFGASAEGPKGCPEASPRDHWRAHLHVVATRAQELDAWPGAALVGHLAGGFGIDHGQRIRGLGNLADVTRYDPALAAGEHWPWRGNLAYAAYEADYMRAQAARDQALAADGARVVAVFTGEVLSQLEERAVTLPSAAELARFDTLEVEIVQRCPDPDKPEQGNCGAWDYLATLSLRQPDSGDGASLREVARFITAYHREADWLVDATPMLALISAGGTRQLRWEFAPEWNVQPTATWLSLRFSNRNKGLRPVSVTPLFSGGDFGSAYNDREPVAVEVGGGTRRAEVWTLVTGHGSGPNRCAEFCAHSHVIGVGGSEYFKGFIEAGVDDGCIGAIARGMTPNQGGTWWFGRGGWCPGAPVEPWVIDVSADVRAGERATFTYRGLLGGRAPPDGSGNIVLTSYLVLYEYSGPHSD